MKKITILVLLSVLIGGLSSNVFCQTYLVNENFESYAVDSFPSSGGWEIIYNGYGNSYQAVSNETCMSGTKSLRLEGNTDWAARIIKPLSFTPDVLWFECYMKPTKVDPSVMNYPVAGISIFNKDIGTWGTDYAIVVFDYDDTIWFTEDYTFLQTYNEGQWYKVRVKYDALNRKGDVWIDDILKASNVDLSGPAGSYNSICLIAGNDTHTKCWFDDVKVWYSSVGIIDTDLYSIGNIYPNPAKDNIICEGLMCGKVEIINLTGQVIKTIYVTGMKTNIDISKLSRGLYILRNSTTNGIVMKKLMKE